MPEHSVFMATLAVGVLLFIGTLSSIVGAFLISGVSGWVKSLSKENFLLESRVSWLEQKNKDLELSTANALNDHLTKISQLLIMMADASDMNLGPEEISKKIRARLHNMGVLKKKGE
jgi:predicted PurR-regulated permease PerM